MNYRQDVQLRNRDYWQVENHDSHLLHYSGYGDNGTIEIPKPRVIEMTDHRCVRDILDTLLASFMLLCLDKTLCIDVMTRFIFSNLQITRYKEHDKADSQKE